MGQDAQNAQETQDGDEDLDEDRQKGETISLRGPSVWDNRFMIRLATGAD